MTLSSSAREVGHALPRLAWVVLLLGCACGRTGLVDAASDGGLGPSCAALVTRDPDAELMDRWNQAVDSAQPLTREFHWVDVASFPHPTTRRGDSTAYLEFTTVLVAFWRAADNLDFVRCNALFDKPYRGGPAMTRPILLRPLTGELKTFSLVPVERQLELEAICTLIGC